MKFDIRLLHPDARLPTRATKRSAGWDLYSAERVELYQNQPVKISLGFAIDLDSGPVPCEMEIRPRSSFSIGRGILVHNGTVDADYREEVKVLIMNLWRDTIVIEVGQRIAQAVFHPIVIRLNGFQGVDSLVTTDRQGGFGSTGE